MDWLDLLFQYVKFTVVRVVFKIRKSLPLFFNDHARIATLYAYSVLALFQNPKISLSRKLRLINGLSRDFSLDISLQRFVETLITDPRREEFCKFCREHPGLVSSDTRPWLEHAKQNLTVMPTLMTLRKQTFKERLLFPKRPNLSPGYSQLIYDDGEKDINNFQIEHYEQSNTINSSVAILCVPTITRLEEGLELLRPFKRIIVITPFVVRQNQIESGIRNILGDGPELEFIDAFDRHVAPYSEGDQRVSDFCDRFGEQFVHNVFRDKGLRCQVSEFLDPELSVFVSDTVYRPVQMFYAALKAALSFSSDIPIFYSGSVEAFPRIMARKQKNPVYVLIHRISGRFKGDPTGHKNAAEDRDQNERVAQIFNKISNQLDQAMPTMTTDKDRQVYVIGHTTHSTYRRGNALVCELFAESSDIAVYDFIVPRGKVQTAKASVNPCLHNALQAANSRECTILAEYIGLYDNLPENLHLDDEINVSDISDILFEALERDMSAFIGGVIMQKKLVKEIKALKQAALMLIPGRFGPMRCVAAAFKEVGFPIFDIQILFVSEMARYKPACADYFPVIDSFSADHYQNVWNLDPSRIKTIGSILLDDDIKLALTADKKAVRKSLNVERRQKIMTFAAQPIAEYELFSSIRSMAAYVKSHKDFHLCVKLHPVQSDDLMQDIETELAELFGDDRRYSVERNMPFWKVIAVTDILVSYFSNVCLMAPYFNVPLVTLPTTSPQPALTLSKMGLSTQVDHLDDFPAVMDNILERQKSKSDLKDLPPAPYVDRNPHMVSSNSLQILSEFIERSIAAHPR